MARDVEIITSIDSISKRLGKVTDMEGLTSSIGEIIDSIVEVAYTGLYLFDPLSRGLKLYCAKGFTKEEQKEAERTAMERHPGEVFMNQKTLIIDDVEGDSKKQSRSSERSFRVRSRLWLPVKSIDESVGAFGLASPKKNAFSDLHVALLSFTCNLAGVVYKNIIYAGEKRVFEKQITSFKTEKTQLEIEIDEIKSKQQNLERSLTERELLIKEIHHRVKNNMQVITSLINLRLNDKNTDVLPEYSYYMKDLMNKIRSMALVHEVVDESNDFSKINIVEYVRRVSELSCQEYDIHPDKLHYQYGGVNMYVDLEKGLLCGLIVHELITNAIKHGFNENLNGDNHISVGVLQKKNKPLELVVQDNGTPFNEDFDLENSHSFGMGIVESLVQQIGGTLSLDKAKKRYCLNFSLNGQG
jgi:two-component sensor histidine kinase/putative methionine-R-sulfoxide reductase with GAF domain